MNQPPGARVLPVGLVEQLQDIREPGGVGPWPLAPGWWGILGATAAVVALFARRYRRRTGLRRAALRELRRLYRGYLARNDGAEFAMAVSLLLRRAALARFPRRRVAGLVGGEWLGFLDRAGATRDFTAGPGAQLAQGPFRMDPEVDAEALLRAAERWLRRNT